MSAIPFANFNAPAQRRRRGIFVENASQYFSSSVGATYSDVAPAGAVDLFGGWLYKDAAPDGAMARGVHAASRPAARTASPDSTASKRRVLKRH